MSSKKDFGILIGTFFLLLFLWSIFSYSLTDPNLVLFRFEPYQIFQKWMWQTFFNNPHLLTYFFVGLVSLLFVNYCLIVKNALSNKWLSSLSIKHLVLGYLLIISPLLLSYNALSHDVFNYIFNAKMVVQYHDNPHISTALKYSDDVMIKHMHNVHTPAPYGYGWTAFSILPSLLGLGKHYITWQVFRMLSVVGIVGLFFALKYLGSTLFGKSPSISKFVVLFFNPLFLIELVSNSHNDLWMIVPAVFSIGLLINSKNNQKPIRGIFLSAILLGFSVSIKMATLSLAPVWIGILLVDIFKSQLSEKITKKIPLMKRFIEKFFNELEKRLFLFLPLICSILLFLPLFTPRSKQFLPWYLIWSLSWLPLISNRFWRGLLIVGSISSMSRYLPWLWTGEYSPQVLTDQIYIVWTPILIYLLFTILKRFSSRLPPNQLQ